MTEIPGRNITESGRVYLVGHEDGTGPVKVGYTTARRLRARVNELRSRVPNAPGGVLMPDGVDQKRLRLLASVVGDLAMERHLKWQFDDRLVCGEWFDLGPGAVPLFLRETVRLGAAPVDGDSPSGQATATGLRMAVNCGNRYWMGRWS